MAFASGPISYQRFYLSSRLAGHLTDAMLSAITARAMGRSGVLSDDTQIGWIGPRHVLDTEITGEAIAFGSFLHLGLRVDRLRVPSNILKAYIRQEEDAIKASSGREFLSKGERKKAREAALLRAEQEARDGSFRRMNAYPVLLDLASKRAFLAAGSTGVGDKFVKLCNDTFGHSPEPATPETVARRIMAGAKNPAAIDHVAAMRLVKPPDGFDSDRAGGSFSGGDLSFLGKELLTWVWHQSDADEGRLAVSTGDEVSVMLDKTLRLKCDFGMTGAVTISADGPTGLPEARAALAVGKQPVKAGVILGARSGEFRFTLDATRFVLSGLTLPEETSEQDARARLEARFELIGESADLLDALFQAFIEVRIAADWSKKHRELSRWAAADSEPRAQARGQLSAGARAG